MAGANIVEVIRRETAAFRGKPAVVQGNRSLSYAEVLDLAAALGRELTEQGVRPLDRVALLAPDSPEYVIASLAILVIGAVVVPVPDSLTGGEVQEVLDLVDVHGLLSGVPGRCPDRAIRMGSAPFTWMPRSPRHEPDDVYPRMNPAFIRFSSGTTGTSKGVLLSHESVLARTAAADRGLGMKPEDVVLWVLSMSYHFVVSILLFLRRGCTIVLCSNDFPAGLLEAVQRHEASFIYASPLHYHALASAAGLTPESLGGVRMAVSTAVKLPAEDAEAFARRFGFELAEAYGIIEVGLPLVNLAPTRSHRGSVGKPLPDFELRIDRPGSDGSGEVYLRGPGMFDAYVSPWMPSRDCLVDGWFPTGDLGRIGEDGSVFIVGRTKDVINFAGMKVFPYEVEEVLLQHPAVGDALVYGVAHPRFGQVPAANVVLARGKGAILPAELRRFCLERLAPYKTPKSFAFVEGIERTDSGKVKR